MGAPNSPQEIRPALQVVTWALVGVVGIAFAVLVVFFGSLPGLVGLLVVLVAGGLWWWQTARASGRGNRDGGR